MGCALLGALCIRAGRKMQEAGMKGDEEKYIEWEQKMAIICRAAREAADAIA